MALFVMMRGRLLYGDSVRKSFTSELLIRFLEAAATGHRRFFGHLPPPGTPAPPVGDKEGSGTTAS